MDYNKLIETMIVKRSIPKVILQYKEHGIKRLSNLNRNTLLKLILFVDKNITKNINQY